MKLELISECCSLKRLAGFLQEFEPRQDGSQTLMLRNEHAFLIVCMLDVTTNKDHFPCYSIKDLEFEEHHWNTIKTTVYYSEETFSRPQHYQQLQYHLE